MKKVLTGILMAAALTVSAETPLWMRDVMISPQGDRIAFTYMGDIWIVPTTGGTATRLTATPFYESVPVWSPDGKNIAFATDRFGGQDIMVVPSTGGTSTRLTSNSVTETPMAFTPDGKEVVFSASIQDPSASVLFPTGRMTEVYTVPVSGGRPVQMLATPAQMLWWVPGSRNFVYQDEKGVENEWRKHHTSSITRDIWLYDASTGRHTNLTAHAGEDRNPVVSADGKTLYFLSERDGGSMNVYSMPISGGTPTALTSFAEHPVRFLSQASDGTMALTWDGEIYTMRHGEQPRKVSIDVTVDTASTPERIRFSRGASEWEVSPDGTQLALIYRGDVFVASVEHESMKQITCTPQAERDLTWAPDGKALYYTSERDGHYNIYRAERGRDEDPNFSNATIITETPLFAATDHVERARPMISPDGKKMLFVEDRNKLMLMDLENGTVKRLTNGETYPQRDGDFTMEWGPDSRWIALEVMARRHEPYCDVAILDTETGEIINLTNSGYFDKQPHWVMGGKAILFRSDRYGMRNHASWGSLEDAMIIFLTQDAYDRFILSEEDYALLKETEKDADSSTSPSATGVTIDRRGLDRRMVRLTPASADLSDVILDKDGETLYYLAAFEQGYDLWKKSLRDGEVSVVKKLDSRPSGFQILPKSGTIYLLGSTVRKLNPNNEKVTNISYSGTMSLDRAAEREYMLNYVENEERERFYRTDMHGVDWPSLVAHYRRFLPHINNNYDFAEMLSELLGELNVSHTGGGYFADGAEEPTAALGLLYDLSKRSEGLTVTEVIEGGPFDRAGSQMAAGAVITAINGIGITADTDWSALLANAAGRKTLVTFSIPGQDMPVDEVILPISLSKQNNLLYDRWVRGRAVYVDSVSGGRLGYVHIKSMSDDSFRTVYSDVLGKYNDREGIVIDTRFNGGGRLHEDIEVLFSGKHYFTQVVRGIESCDMPSRRWNKPSIMVTAEANYSNAHGTPFVYKTMGLGKVVGAPVPGTMTSVNWVYLQDDDLYFGIPVIGYRLDDGTYLENRQLEPDILILNDPALVVKGVDAQLRTAVEALLRDIDAAR